MKTDQNTIFMNTIKNKTLADKSIKHSNHVVVSPQQFLRMADNSRRRIKAVRFILPKIGNPGDFGKFVIKYGR